jgi:hypothetical protein
LTWGRVVSNAGTWQIQFANRKRFVANLYILIKSLSTAALEASVVLNLASDNGTGRNAMLVVCFRFKALTLNDSSACQTCLKIDQI